MKSQMTLAGMEEGFVTDYFRDNYLNNGIVDRNSLGFLLWCTTNDCAGVKVLIDAGVSESSMF